MTAKVRELWTEAVRAKEPAGLVLTSERTGSPGRRITGITEDRGLVRGIRGSINHVLVTFS